VVIGAKTLEQLKDNLGAVEFKLDEADMQTLDEASDFPLPYPYEQIKRMNKGRM
jgi:aryl-alcohol dehydrogenase-like predicted oxidoreductase